MNENVSQTGIASVKKRFVSRLEHVCGQENWPSSQVQLIHGITHRIWGYLSGGYEVFYLPECNFRYLLHPGSLLRLFFDSVCEGYRFLRNVGRLSTDC
jgi:hypothetical protein